MVEVAAWLVAAVIGLEVGLNFLVQYLRRDFQWLLVAQDEKPVLDAAALQRFIDHSYDSELGWVRKPDTTGKERGPIPTSYSIDRRGARANPGHEALPVEIAVYGDSFAFCRQVNNDQTWEWHLSELTTTDVLNFGVGNYGADQAILRMEREFPSNPSRVIILCVVPETIVRLHSVWKHYCEYGNTFAFKPRFKIEGDELSLLANPMDRPDKLFKMTKYLDRIRPEDQFYRTKFRRDILRTPVMAAIWKNPRRNFALIGALLAQKLLGTRFDDWPMQIVLDHNFKIVRRMYADPHCCELFARVINRFATYARARGAVPIVLPLPYLYDVHHSVLNGSYYQSFFDRLIREQNLPVCDVMSGMASRDDLSQLYVSDHYGGHLSPAGNEFVAGRVNEFLRQHRLVGHDDDDRGCAGTTHAMPPAGIMPL